MRHHALIIMPELCDMLPQRRDLVQAAAPRLPQQVPVLRARDRSEAPRPLRCFVVPDDLPLVVLVQEPVRLIRQNQRLRAPPERPDLQSCQTLRQLPTGELAAPIRREDDPAVARIDADRVAVRRPRTQAHDRNPMHGRRSRGERRSETPRLIILVLDQCPRRCAEMHIDERDQRVVPAHRSRMPDDRDSPGIRAGHLRRRPGDQQQSRQHRQTRRRQPSGAASGQPQVKPPNAPVERGMHGLRLPPRRQRNRRISKAPAGQHVNQPGPNPHAPPTGSPLPPPASSANARCLHGPAPPQRARQDEPPPNLSAEAIFTNENRPAEHLGRQRRPSQPSRTCAPAIPHDAPPPAQASESRTRAPNVPRGEMNAPAFASVTVIPCSRSRATAAAASRTVSAIMNIPSP